MTEVSIPRRMLIDWAKEEIEASLKSFVEERVKELDIEDAIELKKQRDRVLKFLGRKSK